MGVTRVELFTEKQNQLAQMAKVLGHPARIAIIQHLLKSNTCINSDLVNELGLAQATISQHLRELKNTGLIQGSIEGVSVCYCIDSKVWNEFRDAFVQLFDQLNMNDVSSCC
ncbi:MAG TPA: metalloregulator ArsR/SmtB family transcription factor [Saprospiraceae bacterium]|nr:metalloregulator ArsR/SmtB family transcription factor [Saprospiraceae bacterium]